MSVTVSMVQASRPGQLVASAADLGTKVAALDTVLAAQRHALAQLRASWQGQAADAAITRAEGNLDRQEEWRARLAALQRALHSGGTRMGFTRNGLSAIVESLRGIGWQVAEDGTATPPPVPVILRLLAPAWTTLIQKLLALFAEADAQTAAALAAALGGAVPATPPGTLGDPRRPPAPGTGAEDVKKWWDSLSRAERAQLIAEHPGELGNLNGIPAEVRSSVNQAVLQDDLDRVTDAAGRHGVSTEEVLADPGAYGLTAADATRYGNAVQTRKGLDKMEGAGKRDRPVLLWAYDPLAFNGQGKAAVAIGNPDRAQNTAVVVPGTGSSVKDGWLESDNATNLYDQMRLGDPDEPASVIAWMGYDAPDSPTDTRIATPGLARTGGDLLAADVNGLGVTHQGGPSDVTVIGHSYGSTTVANAFAASGMRADNAVLIGSPGTDLAHSAADFHLPEGGQVYVGAASSDPVSWLGQAGPIPDIVNRELGYPLGMEAGLGRDPAGDGFGSVRFDAEVPGRSGLPDFGDHSRYYDIGSESLRAMTDIANGNGDTLADNGYTAEGRRQPHIGLPDVVDLPGLPPIDLPDWDTRIPGTPALNDPEGDRGTVTKNHQY
ncbi:alpha/beta hydrolase [Mycolicibacterium diernhoferi]|uniref:Alpha/beta hydrolase n=1 Tax=Mycolicibacterium diernhoferi TaxID=1801 RepID=A0A1Q4H807_9MYCO|nr:alpha/beta hydrolase [Mycolicibacterium diernhoferi]OJZ63689.1 alpha/beta hydrolase [Mycolicibacterium diernhoferi]OPE45158.1 alpha/beta hydrolase [Mycolicibacterium diernhoferi]PEG51362.1 alpha/beta hydrolase [Mycolicibacterium diernhoferi]QYL22782.1 alpha/beta hydrolase [Mycolicibacterium diernhoferi]